MEAVPHKMVLKAHPVQHQIVEKIEELIMELEQDLANMRERFGDANIYKNPEQFARLQQDYDSKTAELDLLYKAYERRAG